MCFRSLYGDASSVCRNELELCKLALFSSIQLLAMNCYVHTEWKSPFRGSTYARLAHPPFWGWIYTSLANFGHEPCCRQPSVESLWKQVTQNSPGQVHFAVQIVSNSLPSVLLQISNYFLSHTISATQDHLYMPSSIKPPFTFQQVQCIPTWGLLQLYNALLLPLSWNTKNLRHPSTSCTSSCHIHYKYDRILSNKWHLELCQYAQWYQL